MYYLWKTRSRPSAACSMLFVFFRLGMNMGLGLGFVHCEFSMVTPTKIISGLSVLVLNWIPDFPLL